MPDPHAIAQSDSTALRSDKPSATSRCEVWSRPPCATERPARVLATVTKAVSKSGTSSSKTGSSSTATVPRL